MSLHSLSHTDNVRCYLCPVHTRAHSLYLCFLLSRMLFSPHTQNLWHLKCIWYLKWPQVTEAKMMLSRARHLSDSSLYSATPKRTVEKRPPLLFNWLINMLLLRVLYILPTLSNDPLVMRSALLSQKMQRHNRATTLIVIAARKSVQFMTKRIVHESKNSTSTFIHGLSIILTTQACYEWWHLEPQISENLKRKTVKVLKSA